MRTNLNASNANRCFNCTPSLMMENQIKEARTDKYKTEGTLAHQLSVLLINKDLKRISEDEYFKKIKEIKSDSKFNNIMLKSARGFKNHVINKFNEAKENKGYCKLYTEYKVDYSDYIPEGFGRIDVVIINYESAHILDFKYGIGQDVQAEGNPQLKLYALGIIKKYNTVAEVKATIYQPRRKKCGTANYKKEELIEWGNDFVKSKVSLILHGKGICVKGSYCRECPNKPECREWEKSYLEMLKIKKRYVDPKIMSNKDLEEVLKNKSELIGWLDIAEEEMLRRALEEGVQYENFYLGESNGRRQITDINEAIVRLREFGLFDNEIFKLNNLCELEEIVGGREEFDRLLGDIIVKGKGNKKLKSRNY